MTRKRSRNHDRAGKARAAVEAVDMPLSDVEELEQAIAEDQAHKEARVKRRRSGMAAVAGKEVEAAPPAPENALRADLPLQGLTPQQEQFAQLVASGVKKSEAYRSAYNVGPDTKANTVNVDACKLAQHPKVSQRISQLNKAQTQQTAHSASDIRAKCVQTLLETLEGEATAAAKLKAVELLGKMAGVDLFRDTLVTQTDDRSAKDIEEELVAKLRSLLGGEESEDVSP